MTTKKFCGSKKGNNRLTKNSGQQWRTAKKIFRKESTTRHFQEILRKQTGQYGMCKELCRGKKGNKEILRKKKGNKRLSKTNREQRKERTPGQR